MDQPLIRNFIIFIVVMFLCCGGLVYGLIKGDKTLDYSDGLVGNTHQVIIQAEELTSLVQGMLATQRGYLLTKDTNFLDRYEEKKQEVSEHIAVLSELTLDNASQQSRLDEVRQSFSELSQKLEERVQYVEAENDVSALQDVQVIDDIQKNIIRLNTSILEEEHELLNARVGDLEAKKEQYFYTLLIGIVSGTILLLTFNFYLLIAQQKRIKMQNSLTVTESRLKLAVEGTQDGIFDWNIETGEVFYSAQYFKMLGYQRGATTATTDEVKNLLHPDDKERFWKYVEEYLAGNLSEYNQEFRLKHQSDQWVWIQARAKAIYNSKGKPIRMVGAHTDVTHLVIAKERLVQDKIVAEEANNAKSEFLAHMSHEIRTPLTAISGIAEILQKNNTNLDDKQKQLVRTLSNSSMALKELVNDILDFSKSESGEIDFDQQVFKLGGLFEEIISLMSLRANEKGISFVFDYSGLTHRDFYGDPKRLRQILINLVGNAIKFTDKGGVTIKAVEEVRENQPFVRVDVSDTGIGIAPEHFDLVFERFKQADPSVNRKYGGTGLGLPISRNLAQLMDGDIILSSEVNKGSTFTLLLPQKIEQTTGSEDDYQVMNKKLTDKIQSALKGETKILIVEDYEGNIVVLGYILDDLGLKYDVARTGKEACEMWQDNHYDIILMDVQMPEMDGFAATAAIRQAEKEKNIPETPIIGMTAHALVGDKDKCISAGMSAYLPKPIVEADLKKQLLEFIDTKKKAA